MEVRKKMDEGQTVDFIAAVIPELNLRLRKSELKGDYKNIIKLISQFAEDVIYAKDWHRFEWIMQVMAYVHDRGTSELQFVINGLLPNTFFRLKKACNSIEWNYLEARLPLSIQRLVLPEDTCDKEKNKHAEYRSYENN
ncbi:hypothetical protein D7322_04565 [Sphingobacterium puteale]|uniref:Uncharacterized protein n=1 Tax=Sphingobacterium puteale TaxID=2420510 RepID=A0A420W2D5_9SPHI|nr:hypothetical protein [Sphingobacterium puteale]RKO72721.1 hypothetical protein D7322_04565 [Sphingobacterium puteale]